MEVWSKGLCYVLFGVAVYGPALSWASECPVDCPCTRGSCTFALTDPVRCPDRFTTLPGIHAKGVHECVCKPGFKGNFNLSCEPCDIGEYCPLNSVEPVACPRGFECNASTAVPLPGRWNGTEFQLCPAKYTCSRDGLSPPVLCDAGSYCPEGVDDSLLCPAGSFCREGSAEPEICIAGSFCGPGVMEPAPCPAASFCPVGSAVPVACPAASFCPAGAAEYLTCLAGSYCGVGVSEGTRCPLGFYCGANSSLPVACSHGMLCLEGSSSDSVPCPSGMTCVGNVIVPCVAGKYCPSGSSAGITCPDGSFCSAGLSEPIVCDRGIICPPGSVDDKTPCPPGMHCVGGKAYQCPASLFCPMGSYAGVLCPAASYCPAGSASPLACPVKKFCPAGVSQPVDCVAGSYCPKNSPHPVICPQYFYCPAHSAAPIPCPHGRLCPEGSSGTEQMCPPGKVCEGGVARSCPATYYCYEGGQVACLDGEVCVEGSSAPAICQAGTFCPAGSLEPQLCPEEYFCAERVGMFAPCPDGALCPAGVVEPCFGVPSLAQNLTRFCKWNCTSGYTVNADATECIAQNGTSYATLLDFGTGDAVVDRLFLKNLTGQVEVQGGCGITTQCKAMVLSILRRDGTTVYCDHGYCPGYDSDGNELPNTTVTASVTGGIITTTTALEEIETTADELDFVGSESPRTTATTSGKGGIITTTTALEEIETTADQLDFVGSESPRTTATASVTSGGRRTTTTALEEIETTADLIEFAAMPDDDVMAASRNASGRRLLQAAVTPVPSINPRVAVGLISVTPVSANISFKVTVGDFELTYTISFNIPVNNTAFGSTKDLILRIIELILNPPQPTPAPVVYPITADQVTTLTWSVVVAVACLVVAVLLCFYVVCKRDVYWCCGLMCASCCGVKADKGKGSGTEQVGGVTAEDILKILENGGTAPNNDTTTLLREALQKRGSTKTGCKMEWPRISTDNHMKMV